MDSDETSVIPVKVAVRVRPFDDREKEENAQQSIKYFVQQNQVYIDFYFIIIFFSYWLMNDYLHLILYSIHFHHNNPFMIHVQHHLSINSLKVYSFIYY